MNKNKSELVSSYQQYLPIILQEDAFIGRFLLAFEKILSGLGETTDQTQIITVDTQTSPSLEETLGLEEIINRIHLYFKPQQTPEEFLPWLASWVALSLRDDWKVEVKRAFIQQIVQLYRLRGTKQGLIQILKLYLTNSGFGDKVEVFDRFDHFPNYFQVQLTLNDRDPEKYWRQTKIAKAIIDQEKPAHTFYTLRILVPTMQLTKRSQAIYPFQLFNSPETQEFIIEVAITPNQVTPERIPAIAKQIALQIQGDLTTINPYAPLVTTNNQTVYIKQKISYQQFLDNLSKFNIILSNRTDSLLVGNLAVNLYFQLNGKEYRNQILSQSLSLLPVLKVCRKDSLGRVVEGNTILKQASELQRSGMQITQLMWTEPYRFSLFDLPINQQLELEAVVEIIAPQVVTIELINKITVWLKDDDSKFHLLIPNTKIDNNKVRITRQLDYQQFLQTLDRLKLIVKNLNNVAVSGKVSVQVTMNINQHSSSFQLFEESFNLAAVPPKDILQICYQDADGKVVTKGTDTVLTILGTT